MAPNQNQMLNQEEVIQNVQLTQLLQVKELPV